LTKRLAVALAVAMSIGAVLLVATGRVGTLRLVSIAVACLLLPGLGWALRSPLRDAGDKLALAIGISICVITLIGTTMAVTGRWSTSGGAIALLAVAITGFLSRGVLKAIGAGLKWLLNLFAGPEAYPAVRVPEDRPVADGNGSMPPISGEDLRSPSAAGTFS
jgi:hypothetical protein